MTTDTLKNIIEAALLTVDSPLTIERIQSLFEIEPPNRNDIKQCLEQLQQEYEGRGVELRELGNGWRVQTRAELSDWISRLWEEKPARFSRAFLETLALIAYRQPITRAEIEEIRGVAVSSNIVKTMLERRWVRVVGHKDVPGKPELLATTREFLNYFNLQSLEDLPTLMEIKDMESQAKSIEEEMMPDLFDQAMFVEQGDQAEKVNETDENHTGPDTESLISGEGDGIPELGIESKSDQQLAEDQEQSQLNEINTDEITNSEAEEIIEPDFSTSDITEVKEESITVETLPDEEEPDNSTLK